ncbi:RNHCP domain-containing protein [uncultured Cohaesibacter sp.]|uniref:RNHCP domain-containing protein n=1 Tax=uncultured Cohaesibacter sp. TaxID=1002546 RepID=UPI002AA8F854|nr:RNHCP domain-containing protein [uncultured Cohaesibacter sp.]
MFYDKNTHGRPHSRSEQNNCSKKKQHKTKRWQATDREFRCVHCKQMVFLTSDMGTVHRNHCPHCLHSLHVDTKPGNRASLCRARMEPVGLTRKHNGFDKYGRERGGDIMIVHLCSGCGAVNINRIAADDCCDLILALFEQSHFMDPSQRAVIERAGIQLLDTHDAEQLHIALFGKRWTP